METFRLQLRRAADVVDVIGVPAVDQDVPLLHPGDEIGQGVVDHGGGDHQPDRPGPVQLLHQLVEREGPHRPLPDQRIHRFRVDVIRDALMPPAHQATDHVGPHPTQADHSELHA
jgi:hypothetical protein